MSRSAQRQGSVEPERVLLLELLLLEASYLVLTTEMLPCGTAVSFRGCEGDVLEEPLGGKSRVRSEHLWPEAGGEILAE